MSTSMQAVLDRMRRSLLDLTRRNRLLNFKGTGRTSLAIVDERAEEVLRLLGIEGKTMQFLAREEAKDTPEEAAAADEAAVALKEERSDVPAEWEGSRFDYGASLALAPIDDEVPARHQDMFLQTGLTGEGLQDRLVHLAREARSAIEERGANILYLTLGMVEWTDAGTDVTSRAPLLFVPVELRRKNVNSRYAVSRLDDEIVTNPSLTELASRMGETGLPPADLGEEEFSLPVYLSKVADAIAEIPGWTLADENHLGLFSFAKLLLYQDLDASRWPAGARLEEHPLIAVLAGADGATLEGFDGVPDASTLDDAVPPEECWQVVDADSSQHAAILAAKRGESLVIQGPPGTGKSQTITNIVAECLADGKSVLFVAEKAAALEVVHRRLEKVGLGDFVLELHSRSASKRKVLEELKRALDVPGRERSVDEGVAKEVDRARERLNAYVRALHAPVGGLELSAFDAMVRAAERRDAPEAAFDVPDHFDWTEDELDRVVEGIGALDRCLERLGPPTEHPWRGTRATSAGLEMRQRIEERRPEAVQAVRELLAVAMELTDGLKVPVPRTDRDLGRLLVDLALLREAPREVAIAVGDSRWDAIDAAVGAHLKRGRALAESRADWRDRMIEDVARTSWDEVLLRRRVDAESFFRLFKPSWYADGRRIRAFMKERQLPSVDEQVRLLRAVEESRRIEREIQDDRGVCDRFGGLPAGEDADFEVLERFANAAVAVREIERRGGVGAGAMRRILESPDRGALAEEMARVEERRERFSRAAGWVLEAVSADEVEWWGDRLDATDFDAVETRFVSLAGAMEQLSDQVDYRAALAAIDEPRIRPFLLWVHGRSGEVGLGRLPEVFLRQFTFLFADRALDQHEVLRGHRGEDHGALLERFRAADRTWIGATRQRLRKRLRERRPDFGHDASRESKLGILKHEMRKKRRHLPLRRLFDLCGDVVSSIKPCFMMSPISVAQYLKPGARAFDVVIFDEASQVEPADAFGAIARGKQVLLIGDEKQLPPTDFFTKMERDDVSGPEDDELGSAADLESILGVGAVRFPARNQCSLEWHYRSLHQSLIEFSNARFYDHRLKVFPAPRTGRDEAGLVLRYLPDAVYQRGDGVNPDEARAVAEACLKHAAEFPESTLGVGSFSVSQQRQIEDEVERLRRAAKNRKVERFFRADADEPFFVKNLETIQGDERDVIFLSVGYGPDADRKVSMNLGPLNKDGGWRRLNVLVTRARRRCEVFSSMRAEDMRLEATKAPGVHALHAYLATAAAGELVGVPRPSLERAAPLAAAVASALRDRGWEINVGVGLAGFSVDLGVIHPEDPARYVCGIECDGAPYRDAKTARDRDRTRPEVLVARGWAIERVWSTDWFKRPTAVLDQLDARLRELVSSGPKTPPPVPPAPLVSRTDESAVESAIDTAEARAEEAGPPDGVVAYRAARPRALGGHEDLVGLSPAVLRDHVVRVVREEGPVHREHALRVLTSWFDTRSTQKTREAFEMGCAAALDKGLIDARDAFLWPSGFDASTVRWRGDDDAVTEIDRIPPEEIEAAVRLALDKELGIRAAGLPASVRRLFGFGSTGGRLSAAVDAAVERLRARNEVEEDASGFLGRIAAP